MMKCSAAQVTLSSRLELEGFLPVTCFLSSLNLRYLHFAEHAEQAEQAEQLNIVSYLVMLLWRQLFSATIGSHMRP